MRLTNLNRFIAVAVAATLLSGILPNFAHAASISYGNFGPVAPGITYLNVTESSGTDPVPLYGPPTGFAGGISFTPTNFLAVSAGGTPDVTDGQLNYTVMSPGLTSIALSEGGNFSLFGLGTGATQVFAGASLRVTVTQLNGVNVTPIVLSSSNVSAGFNLLANSGSNLPWSVGTSVNVAGQLAALGYLPGQVATKANIVIDNQLLAVSQSLSSADIAKTRFELDLNTIVPEPSTMALAGLALCGLASLVGRKQS